MKTSQTHTLRIDVVEVPKSAGRIGLTFCPGKRQSHGMTGAWQRDLDADMDLIAGFGAAALVTLMEADELAEVEVPVERLRHAAVSRGIDWFLLPIVDVSIPDRHFETQWIYAGLRLRRLLRAGQSIAIHCRGGLGRTGTIAGRLLTELGLPAERAIASIREARPGSIETAEQAQYVRLTPVLDDREADDARRSRKLGCLLGGAVGDAFGYAIEFNRWEQIQRTHGSDGLQTPIRSNGKLIVSDDTQMTLFTLEGLLDSLAHDPSGDRDIIRSRIRDAYLDWLATQKERLDPTNRVGNIYAEPVLRHLRAPGITCLSALRAGGSGTPTEPINDSKGCGGVMRVAPLGLFPDRCNERRSFEWGMDAAAITHGHATGYLAAGAMAAIVRLLLDGVPLREAAHRAQLLQQLPRQRRNRAGDLRCLTIG